MAAAPQHDKNIMIIYVFPVCTPQTSTFRRGEAVKATVLRYGPLGASVLIMSSSTETANSIVVVDTNQQQMGLILQDQIEYWAALNKRDPQVGEILNAYIQKVGRRCRILYCSRVEWPVLLYLGSYLKTAHLFFILLL